MLACSVLIGTMLAAVLELRDKRSSLRFLCNVLFSLLHLPDLCFYSGGTLSASLVSPQWTKTCYTFRTVSVHSLFVKSRRNQGFICGMMPGGLRRLVQVYRAINVKGHVTSLLPEKSRKETEDDPIWWTTRFLDQERHQSSFPLNQEQSSWPTSNKKT